MHARYRRLTHWPPCGVGPSAPVADRAAAMPALAPDAPHRKEPIMQPASQPTIEFDDADRSQDLPRGARPAARRAGRPAGADRAGVARAARLRRRALPARGRPGDGLPRRRAAGIGRHPAHRRPVRRACWRTRARPSGRRAGLAGPGHATLAAPVRRDRRARPEGHAGVARGAFRRLAVGPHGHAARSHRGSAAPLARRRTRLRACAGDVRLRTGRGRRPGAGRCGRARSPALRAAPVRRGARRGACAGDAGAQRRRRGLAGGHARHLVRQPRLRRASVVARIAVPSRPGRSGRRAAHPR